MSMLCFGTKVESKRSEALNDEEESLRGPRPRWEENDSATLVLSLPPSLFRRGEDGDPRGEPHGFLGKSPSHDGLFSRKVSIRRWTRFVPFPTDSLPRGEWRVDQLGLLRREPSFESMLTRISVSLFQTDVNVETITIVARAWTRSRRRNETVLLSATS